MRNVRTCACICIAGTVPVCMAAISCSSESGTLPSVACLQRKNNASMYMYQYIMYIHDGMLRLVWKVR